MFMKIELHAHSAGFSVCGKLSLEELISLYSARKYDVLVLTNHFNNISKRYYTDNGGRDYLQDYHDWIRQAQKIGADNHLIVLGGYELRFDENANDYLVFGMTEEFTHSCPDLFTMGPAAFGDVARENGFLFYQAHPFRNGMTVIDPKYLFGIEVRNTHPNHDSRNDIALAWAEKHGLHKIAGSDCHKTEHAGTSAIVTDDQIHDMADLVECLKNDRYTIIGEPRQG